METTELTPEEKEELKNLIGMEIARNLSWIKQHEEYSCVRMTGPRDENEPKESRFMRGEFLGRKKKVSILQSIRTKVIGV